MIIFYKHCILPLLAFLMAESLFSPDSIKSIFTFFLALTIAILLSRAIEIAEKK